jgi:hypothetical protein
MKLINTLWVKRKVFNVKSGGTYSYHWFLSGLSITIYHQNSLSTMMKSGKTGSHCSFAVCRFMLSNFLCSFTRDSNEINI